MKFLGFEQIFKNPLTGLNIGGGRGGSDFDRRGRSDDEVMRFCQSFMTELHRHLGEHTDVPAGDIGVGGREIGYLFGPGKAANAGGVATSALEMRQNAARESWTFEEVETRLAAIMRDIHATVRATAERYGVPGNYVAGANIAGFERVADAMLAQGLV